MDFAYQFLPKNFEIIAITGTDGKSTTTWMIYSILEKYYFGKKKIFLSGNFEIPFSETVADILKNTETDGIIVIEISSFMSYYIGKSSLPVFTPDYSILTNLKSDHLNWHRNLQEYLDAKMNLFQNTRKRSIINSQLNNFVSEKNLSLQLPENTILFSSDKSTPDYANKEDVFVENY